MPCGIPPAPTASSTPSTTTRWPLRPRSSRAPSASRSTKDWGLGAPGFGLRGNWFSVRWTTRANFKAETYKFTIAADNGVRVFIDDALVIDRWAAGGNASVNKSMVAGLHTVKVEYFEDAGTPGRPLILIPRLRPARFPRLSRPSRHRLPRRSRPPSRRPPTAVPTPVANVPTPTTLRRRNLRSQVLQRDGNAAVALRRDPVRGHRQQELGHGSPGFGLRDNWFSVRWTSQASFNAANYTFTVLADNGVRVYVDGRS